MNLREAVRWLLDHDYGVMVNGQFHPTQKLHGELGVETPLIMMPIRRAEPAYSTPVSHLTDRKEIWNQFIEDACIPHRVKSPNGGIYTVRQYSLSAVNALVKIISDPNIDYTRFVESTKHYYKTVDYKRILGNYLTDGTWKGEYDEYDKHAADTSGGNRWEE